MNCPICGGQVADSSSFCVHCGGSIAPQTQETVTQEPVAQPQYQQEPVSNNYVADFFDAVKQYIDTAGSVFVPSIVGLALSWAIPVVGQIIGLVMSGNAISKINGLPFVDEALVDPSILGDYQSARKKVKTASILSKICKIYSIVMLIFWICYGIFWVLYLVFFVGLGVLVNM